jgi:hypothetical protein
MCVILSIYDCIFLECGKTRACVGASGSQGKLEDESMPYLNAVQIKQKTYGKLAAILARYGVPVEYL